MKVSDIMTGKPVTVNLKDTLHRALEAMEQVGCHHLPVLGAERRLVGIITERDCRVALKLPEIRREHLQNDRATRLLVRIVMTPAPITAEPDTAVYEAARLMLEYHVSCLPVLLGETLVGIITRSDILRIFIDVSAYPRRANCVLS